MSIFEKTCATHCLIIPFQLCVMTQTMNSNATSFITTDIPYEEKAVNNSNIPSYKNYGIQISIVDGFWTKSYFNTALSLSFIIFSWIGTRFKLGFGHPTFRLFATQIKHCMSNV